MARFFFVTPESTSRAWPMPILLLPSNLYHRDEDIHPAVSVQRICTPEWSATRQNACEGSRVRALLTAMDWSDDGIVLGLRHFGEHSAILEALTREHGRHLGLVRGATSKRLKGALEPGNVLRLHWRARLDQQLGSYAIELAAARAAQFFHDGLKLAGLSAACAITAVTLPEREAHARVFEALDALLIAIAEKASPSWIENYVRFEVALLEDLGFGLDLTQCAMSGARTELAYVSPKTGRAVTETAAAPYRERLLKLPRFLSPEDGVPGIKDFVDGLALTGFFLERVALEPHGAPLPPARVRLSERLAALRGGG